MSNALAVTASQEETPGPQSPAKRRRQQKSDDGPLILPTMEHFIALARKIKRPALLVNLLERASQDALPEMLALAEAAKGCLPADARRILFHSVAKLDSGVQQRIEGAAERICLLSDEYGALAVQLTLDERREDDAAVLNPPTDSISYRSRSEERR